MNRFGLVLVFSLISNGAGVLADETTQGWGVVDLQKTLNRSQAGRSAKYKLKDEAQKLQAPIDRAREKVDDLQIEVDIAQDNAEKDSSKENMKALATKQREFAEAYADLKRAAKEAQDQMNSMQVASENNIVNEVRPIIAEMRKAHKLRAIFDKHKSGILDADDVVDLTTELIDLYDKAYAAEREQNQPAGR